MKHRNTNTETKKGRKEINHTESQKRNTTLIIQKKQKHRKGCPSMPNQYMTYLTPGGTDRAPTGHRRDTDGTPASNEAPTAGTENTNESQQHDHKTRMNTRMNHSNTNECNKHTCRILSSISFSNSQSASAPTGHRRDTDGTPTSNETPTAGTEHTNETQKHYHRTHMSTVRRTHCVYECNKHTCRI